MKITIVAVGTGMPNWVKEAFDDYQRRFPRHESITLIEIPNRARGKNADIKRIMEQECQQMLAACKGGRIVILDIPGKQYDTYELAHKLQNWQLGGQDVYICIGGPEGFTDEFKKQAHEAISLSKLTLPHPMVRVILIEALYRAWSVNNNLPYHRA